MSDQQPWPAREDIPGNTNQSGHAPRGRDGEVMPWDGRRVEPGGERGRAEVIVRYEPDGGSGQPPGGRKRRSFLVLLLALLMVAILAIVVLVITRPKANSALDKPSPAASATSASPSATSPSASGSSAAPADSSTASPAATGTSGAGSSPSTIQASGGGAGAEVADLSALNPVQTGGISGPSNGPEQIGATIYQNSVGFTCYNDNPSYIDYNVAGYKFLNAVIGVPSSASNAAGNSMTVTFFKDGSSNQLSTPVTVSLDHPQSVHLNLDGSSQLEIACTSISATSHSPVSMDGALGNATIGPS
jgi:cytoskeletal protein RodZ